MARYRTIENTPRTLALALTLWGSGVVAGTVSGVFARLAPEELVGLALFAFAFATVTAWIDRRVRTWLDAISPRALISFVIETDVLIAVSAMLALGFTDGAIGPALARFPLALILLFVAPLAATAHLVALARLLRAPGPRVQLTGSETTAFAPGRVESAR